MLNTAIPILQMKISGILLSSIKNMIITIRSVNSSIVKGNADIEVDNDLVSVFLTNEEADKISGGNYNISIIAENISGEDVSELVKVMWTKRGSMSNPVSGGSSDTDMSDYYTKHEVDALIQNIPSGTEVLDTVEEIEANTDAGKATGALVTKLILEMLGGFSFGYTEDGKPGFKEPNGDKFIAFGSESSVEPESKIYKMNWINAGTRNNATGTSTHELRINPKEIKNITLNGSITAGKTGSSGGGYLFLYLYGYKINSTVRQMIKSISSVNGNTVAGVTTQLSNYIIDIENDIDWTIWNKEKQIILLYEISNNYSWGKTDINIELESNNVSEISVVQYVNTYGWNSTWGGYSYLTFYEPELLENIHLSGILKSTRQTSYLKQQGCKNGSTSFTDISVLKTVTANSTVNVNMDYVDVDWSAYDTSKGLRFSMIPTFYDSANYTPLLTGEVTYAIK